VKRDDNTADSIDRYKDLVNIPHGLIIQTGPLSGGGKTSGSVGLLAMVNRGIRSPAFPMELEDPIEYPVELER
jgi:type II secretory ATPase GspE/PulE/Tfp pilus assembly ATPase PilB-like protein